MRPRDVLTAAACVLCWTAPEPAAQTSRLPFDVDQPSAEERPQHSLHEVGIGIRDRHGDCGNWLVDVLVPIGKRFVHVSSAISTRAAPIAVEGILDRQSVLVVRCRGRMGYSLHGPFEWQAWDGLAWFDFHPRRTVRVTSPAEALVSSVLSFILSQGGPAEPWPRCRMLAPCDHECVGVPIDAAAVAVSSGSGAVDWAVVPPARVSVQRVATQTSSWGRLLRLVDVSARSPDDDDLVVQAWRHKSAHASASQPRVRVTTDATVRAFPIDPLALWITGQESAERQFVEVRGKDIVTIRIDVEALKQSRPDHSLVVYLRPDVPVFGTVVDGQDRPVAGAVVSVFEFVAEDAAGGPGRHHATGQRRWIAEATSDANGAFSMSGLATGHYEFLVAHATSGRMTETLRVDGLPMTLRLVGTPRVRGRVLVEGFPSAGVHVRMVPDRDDFLLSDDPLTLLSPPGVTDTDGQFELALPHEGGGEIVVGGNGFATARYRFAGVGDTSSGTDLGDIHLPAPLSVLVRLAAPGCDLMAAGPVGSLGVGLVRRVFDPGDGAYRLWLPEQGFWWLEAECGTESRSVIPSVMQIRQDDVARVIDLTLVAPSPP